MSKSYLQTSEKHTNSHSVSAQTRPPMNDWQQCKHQAWVSFLAISSATAVDVWCIGCSTKAGLGDEQSECTVWRSGYEKRAAGGTVLWAILYGKAIPCYVEAVFPSGLEGRLLSVASTWDRAQPREALTAYECGPSTQWMQLKRRQPLVWNLQCKVDFFQTETLCNVMKTTREMLLRVMSGELSLWESGQWPLQCQWLQPASQPCPRNPAVY